MRTPSSPLEAPSRCRVVRSLAELLAEEAKFGCIYADPPWRFANSASRAAAANHYLTIGVNDLARLPVEQLSAMPCHLHLWVPNSLLREGLNVVEAWGFTYKTCFVWIKTQIGMGNYWRNAHEVLLLGVRGRARFQRRDIRSWKLLRRTSHSTKPDEIRAILETVSPAPRLELFARRTTPGWTVFGNDITRMLF